MICFHVVTLFPELIKGYCQTSIVGRGLRAGQIALKVYNPRDFCPDKYRKVDDTPYGGGAGMVLKPEPFFSAVEAIGRPSDSPLILTTPQGEVFRQEFAQQLSACHEVTIVCGHYEGFDERIRSLATHEVSIGDFVLTGGELAALVVIDAVGRLVPGVIGKQASLFNESFVDNLLEGPQYTKPSNYRGMGVPEILLSGDHRQVARWRRQQALLRTMHRRPDLLARARLNGDDVCFLRQNGYTGPLPETD